jgi:hypothetical protein
MAGLINLRLLTDFFNKIGQQQTIHEFSFQGSSKSSRSLHRRAARKSESWRSDDKFVPTFKRPTLRQEIPKDVDVASSKMTSRVELPNQNLCRFMRRTACGGWP